ncbi:MAG TPA: YabP/YqfC family sporulation protein [Candidatus Fournierella merdipullorum]|uniref:YabP/YqfC family sporulation protein n=1 Tax=Candidatus Allofournierella merdipullorum TaxID=2838595 RepID=A0A9D2E5G4_9FIRM|nr:YabP/YqfC family sporulation protein [Candidatus Fournierella merdipullorum]
MKQKRRAKRESPKAYFKRLVGQPPAGFYRRPILHIQRGGLVEVEGCKGVLLYDENRIRLDMGGWQVSLYGDDLTLCGIGGRMLTLKGRVFRAEFSNEE